MARTSLRRARHRSPTVTALSAAVLALSVPAAVPAGAAPAGTAPGAARTGTAPSAARTGAVAEPAADGVEVVPRRAGPGADLRVRVRVCGDDAKGLASSVAFEKDAALRPGTDAGTAVLAGTAAVRADAEPGTYAVTVTCATGDRAAEGSFRVLAAARPENGPDRQHASRDHRGSPVASPVAPVRAGGGGTAGDRDGAGTGPSGTTGLAFAGSALVLGAATWAVRRRTARPDGR